MNIVRTVTNARKIKDKTPIEIEDVSSWSVANFSDTVLNIIINNVPTPVLPYDPVTKQPGLFTRDGDGTLSDINFTAEYAAAKNGNAILYFNALKKC